MSAIACTPKQFIELYLDLNHVPMIHKGLNSWVDVRKARFECKDSSSIQYAPFNHYAMKRDGYAQYYEAWMDTFGIVPASGAIWKLDYPTGLMVEIYPGMTVVSTVEDIGNGCCRNIVEFTGANQDILRAGMKAYTETADEDNIILENLAIDASMVAEIGGTYHPLLKNGVKHYRAYLEVSR